MLSTVTLGYLSLTQSLAIVIHNGAIERAHLMSPDNGQIAALAALKLSGPEATAADRLVAGRIARAAIINDPTAVVAVSTLGLNRQVAGDALGARHLFRYAEKLSRRDLATQLWAIEDAVGRGNVGGALHHYDIALRTSPGAPDLLFPILASAMSDVNVRAALTSVLAGRPSWGEQFVDFVGAKGPDPRSAAQLLISLRRKKVPVSEEAEAAVVNALIVKGYINDTWAYYASIRPGSDRQRSRDAHFAADLKAASPLDWIPINSEGMSASIQSNDQGGFFEFTAPSGVGGPLLQQLQLLSPGEYRMRGLSVGIDQPENNRPYWTMICRQDGRELGRIVMSNSKEIGSEFSGRFLVPSGCQVQILLLVARPSDSIAGLSGQIARAQLTPTK